MRAFDFDNTIFDGYSCKEFCFFMTARYPIIALYAPMFAATGLLTAMRAISMKKAVELLLWPYLRIKNIDRHVKDFWEKKKHKILPWFKDIVQPGDVVVSAAPHFFIKGICEELGVTHVIATDLDLSTGKINEPYCYREDKWTRFAEVFGEDAVLDEYYTDTLHDSGMLDRAKRGFLVKRGVVTQIK